MSDIIVLICAVVILVDVITNIIVSVEMKRAQRDAEALVKRVEEWDRQDG